MRWTIETCYRVCGEHSAFHEPRAEARDRGLARAHGADREISIRHVIHPPLNRLLIQVAHSRHPSLTTPRERQKLRQIPAIRRYAAFGFSPLLTLVRAELLYELRERHRIGPPARARATFSPLRSIREHDPVVKLRSFHLDGCDRDLPGDLPGTFTGEGFPGARTWPSLGLED